MKTVERGRPFHLAAGHLGRRAPQVTFRRADRSGLGAGSSRKSITRTVRSWHRRRTASATRPAPASPREN